jgi:DnaJ-class molecular chaperone
MASKDPYQILGVSRTATPDEVKRAYRRLAKEYHPDRNPGNKSAEQKFKEVQAAYEVLGDPQRRAQYDRFGAGGPTPEFHTWSTRESPFGGVSFDFDSLGDLTGIFEQFFQRGGVRRGPRRGAPRAAPRGQDVEHSIALSFEEAINGATRQVVLSGSDGTSEHITVHIPAGVHDGQRIRVKGKGQAAAGGRGDLMIRCQIRPHPFFQRDGLNVLLDLPLTFAEAALGTKLELPTPQGPAVVSVPPGTASGTKLRLRERGMPDARSGARGDLLAVVRIVTPKQISPRARELLENLDQELQQKPRANWPARGRP